MYAKRRQFPRAVFRRRRGVVRWRGRWLAFRVVRVHPERIQPLGRARPVIRGILRLERRQQALGAFIEDYEARWKGRTSCSEVYATRDCGRTLP